VPVAHHLQHAVEMARGAGAALHREPHRLVEHQHVVVFVERDRLQKSARLVGFVTRRARLRLIEPQRRNADGLSGLKPVFRFSALAINAHLAFADDALDVRKAKTGKPRLKKSINPHAGFVGAHSDVLNGGRQ
jgi:hypothetical protein